MADQIIKPIIIPISLGFVNAYIVKQNRVIIIDTGTPGSEKKILDTIKINNIEPEDISLIILTHGHQDHAGSASILHHTISAPVVAHIAEVESLQRGRQDSLEPCSMPGSLLKIFFSMKKNSSFFPVIPDIIIDGPFDLNPYGVEGMIIPTPVHTKGSISVTLHSGERFTGDLIFPQIPSGKPGLPFWADEYQNFVPYVRKIADEYSTIFYPGHGGPFAKNDIQAMIDNME